MKRKFNDYLLLGIIFSIFLFFSNVESSLYYQDYGDNPRLASALGVPADKIYIYNTFAVASTELIADSHQTTPPTIFLLDSGYSRILWNYYDGKDWIISSFGSYGNGWGQFSNPSGIAVRSNGEVWISDTWNHRIAKLQCNVSNITVIGYYGSRGSGNGQFDSPSQIAVDKYGNVYVADSGNHRIQKFNSSGNFIKSFGSWGTEEGKFINPKGITVSLDDFVYVADKGNRRIQRFNLEGNFINSITRSEGIPENYTYTSLAVDGYGQIYAVDPLNNLIHKFTSYLEYLTSTVGNPASPFANLNGIGFDLSYDSAGNWWTYGEAFSVENRRAELFFIGMDIVNVYATLPEFTPSQPERNTTYIKFTLTEPGNYSVRIYDNMNRVIRTLVSNTFSFSGSRNILWDGKDDSGNIVSHGIYTVEITATDTYNTKTMTRYLPIRVYIPSVIDIKGFNPPTFRHGQTTSLKYSISKDSSVTIKLYQSIYRFDETTIVRTLINRQWRLSGDNTETWDGKNDQGVLLPDSAYTCIIEAWDSEGLSAYPKSGKVFIYNKASPGAIQITSGAWNDYSSAWSADGKKIAFISDRNGQEEIWIMNADGSGQVKLTQGIDPTWSPDGSKIVFSRLTEGEYNKKKYYSYCIYVMNSDGSNVQQITEWDLLNNAMVPDWSYDGEKIAYQYGYYFWGIFDYWSIFSINPDGSNDTNLTSWFDPYFPSWTHDSKKIGFTKGPVFIDWLFTMNRDGTNKIPIPIPANMVGDYGKISWGPNDSRFAIRFRSNWTQDDEVWIIAPYEDVQFNLTNHPAFDGAASWSLDGKKIAFTSDRSGYYNIWVMPSTILPATSINLGNPKYIDSAGNIFITSNTLINFSGIRGTEETDRIEYAIDRSDSWSTYTGQDIKILTEGKHTIYFKSVDKIGNIEEMKSTDVIVDNTSPLTTAIGKVERTITTKEDWERGIQVDVNSTRIPGDVILGANLALKEEKVQVHTTQADFEAGTRVNISTTENPNSVVLGKQVDGALIQNPNVNASVFILDQTTQRLVQSCQFGPQVWISFLEINLKRIGTADAGARLWVELRGDAGGIPSSALLGQFSVLINNLSTDWSWLNASFGANVRMESNQMFWIYIYVSGTSVAQVSIRNSTQAVNGNIGWSTNSGSTWNQYYNNDLTFNLYGYYYHGTGNIISKIIDYGTTPVTQSNLTAEVNIPNGCTIEFLAETRDIDAGWSNFVSLGVATVGMDKFTADLSTIGIQKKYLKWKAILNTNSSNYTPVLSEVKINYTSVPYLTSGNQTNIIEQISKPEIFGRIYINEEKPAGTDITYKVAYSNDRINFTDFKQITNESLIELQKYVKIEATLSATTDTVTPVLKEISLKYQIPTKVINGISYLDVENIDLIANDSGSGIKETKYRIDAGEWQIFTGSLISVVLDGLHAIDYYSVDNLSNIEEIKTVYIIRDTQVPNTAIIIGDPKYKEVPTYVTSNTLFTLIVTDDGSGIQRTEYGIDKIDGEIQWIDYTQAFTITIADGLHTIYYRSIDKAANIENTKEISIYLDNTAPLTSITNAIIKKITSEGDWQAGISENVDISSSTGDVKLGKELKQSKALSFDGIDDYVNVLASDIWNFGRGDWTISFWSNIDNTAVNVHAGFHVNNISDYIGIYAHHPGYGTAIASASGMVIASNIPAEFNTWRQITVVRRSDIVYLYENGIQTASSAYSGPMNYGSYGLIFGKDMWGNHYKGKIDEIVIYKRALNSSEISDIYNNKVRYEEIPDIVSYWNFDEGNGVVASDSIGINNGTIYGAVWTEGIVVPVYVASGIQTNIVVYDVVPGNSGKFIVEGEKPVGTDITYRISYSDNGNTYTNFIPVVNGGTIEPHKYIKVEATLTTTNINVTPTLKEISLKYQIPTKVINGISYLDVENIDLVASDVGSGIKETKYRIDAGEWQIFTGSLINVVLDGLHAIDYYSIDNLDNTEIIKTAYAVRDKTPPVTTISIGEPKADATVVDPVNSTIISYRTEISLTATDTASTIPSASGVAKTEYRIISGINGNNTEWQVYIEPFKLTTYVDGVYTIQYRSVDNVRNIEEAKKQIVVLDTIKPVAEILSPSKETLAGICNYYNGEITIVGAVADLHFDNYNLEYGTGEVPSEWNIITTNETQITEGILGKFDTTNLVSGVYTIRLTAIDKVQNKKEDKIVITIGTPELQLVLDKELNHPEAVALDKEGYIYVADTNNDCIRKYDTSGNGIAFGSVIASGTKQAHKSQRMFNKPSGIFIDEENNIYVSDRNNDRIVKLDQAGNILFETNKFTLNKPHGLKKADRYLYVADRNNDVIRKYDLEGDLITNLCGGDLNKPEDVFITNEFIYVANRNMDNIRIFNLNGGLIKTIGAPSTSSWQAGSGLNKPSGIYVCNNGEIIVSDTNNDRIVRYDKYGNMQFRFNGITGNHSTSSGFNKPSGITVDGNGNLYVADTNNSRVLVYGNGLSNLIALNVPTNTDNTNISTETITDHEPPGLMRLNKQVADRINKNASEKEKNEKNKIKFGKVENDKLKELGKLMQNHHKKFKDVSAELKQHDKELREKLKVDNLPSYRNENIQPGVFDKPHPTNHIYQYVEIKDKDTMELIWHSNFGAHKGEFKDLRKEYQNNFELIKTLGKDKIFGNNHKDKEKSKEPEKPKEPDKGNSGDNNGNQGGGNQGNQGNDKDNKGNQGNNGNNGNNGNQGNNGNNNGNNGNNGNDKGKGKKSLKMK